MGTNTMIGKDFSPILHAISAITLQCAFGAAVGEWGFGGVLGCLWFISREHTQAEYRWITMFGNGKRINMPWWGGFDPRVWDKASLMDWLVPVAACLALYLIAA